MAGSVQQVSIRPIKQENHQLITFITQPLAIKYYFILCKLSYAHSQCIDLYFCLQSSPVVSLHPRSLAGRHVWYHIHMNTSCVFNGRSHSHTYRHRNSFYTGRATYLHLSIFVGGWAVLHGGCRSAS